MPGQYRHEIHHCPGLGPWRPADVKSVQYQRPDGEDDYTTVDLSTNVSAFARSSEDSATMVWSAWRSTMCRLCMFTPARLNLSATFANAPARPGAAGSGSRPIRS